MGWGRDWSLRRIIPYQSGEFVLMLRWHAHLHGMRMLYEAFEREDLEIKCIGRSSETCFRDREQEQAL